MMIAKKNENNLIVVGNYWDLFPDTSFPTDGPNNDWYAENDCYRINLNVSYDPETEELHSVLPYIENGWAYTLKAFPKES
jgi:hypothetical protein